MCLAVPGKIIELRGQLALVDFQGNRMEVSCMLTPDVSLDDWVLVHAGFAIAEIDEKEAKETWSYLNQLSEIERNEATGASGASDG